MSSDKVSFIALQAVACLLAAVVVAESLTVTQSNSKNICGNGHFACLLPRFPKPTLDFLAAISLSALTLELAGTVPSWKVSRTREL